MTNRTILAVISCLDSALALIEGIKEKNIILLITSLLLSLFSIWLVR